MATNHFDYHKRQPCAYRKCNCASISIQLISSVKPKMFSDQSRLNMFGHKTVPVFHDVASYNRVSNKPSNRNSLKLITTGRTSFSEPARMSTRSKSLFKTTGQQPGSVHCHHHLYIYRTYLKKKDWIEVPIVLEPIGAILVGPNLLLIGGK